MRKYIFDDSLFKPRKPDSRAKTLASRVLTILIKDDNEQVLTADQYANILSRLLNSLDDDNMTILNKVTQLQHEERKTAITGHRNYTK